MACSIANPLGCVSSAASSVAGDAFSSIAHDFANAANSTINWLWVQMGSSTSVHLGGAGFNLDLAIVVAITATVAVGLFVIQVIASTLRRDGSGLARAGKGLLVAFIAGGAAVGVTNLVLGAVDSLCDGVVQVAMGTNMSGMGPKVLSGSAITSVGNPAAMLLLSVAAIAAAVIVWFALMVRKVLIVVSAVFAPLAFAGSLADITVSWTRRWIETMAALVFSKLVLVIIFVVGWGVLDGGVGQSGHGTAQTVTQTASGLLILGVAGLAPWMALKLVHFSGDQFHHLHGLAGAASTGVQKAVAAPQKAMALKSAGVAAVAGAGAGAGAARVGGSSAGSGVGASSQPSQQLATAAGSGSGPSPGGGATPSPSSTNGLAPAVQPRDTAPSGASSLQASAPSRGSGDSGSHPRAPAPSLPALRPDRRVASTPTPPAS